MLNMKKILLAILWLCTIKLCAQNLTELYKPILPSQIIDNKDNLLLVESSLQSAANTHPDAIYPFILYLEARSLNSDKNKIADLLAHYNYVTKSYKEQKFVWLNKLLNNLDLLNNDPETRLLLKKFLTEIIHGLKQEQPGSFSAITLDSNKLNYCSFIYLTRENYEIYDPNKDYSKERSIIENKIVNNIKILASVSYLEQNENKKEELMRDILEKWYLFARLDVSSQIDIISNIFKKRNTPKNEKLTDVYKPFLPKQTFENENNLTMAENNLQRAVNIHPNVIYTYILYIKAQLENGDKINVGNLFSHYNSLITYYTKQKYDWLNKLLDNLDKISDDYEVKKLIKRRFNEEMEKYKTNLPGTYTPLALDSNLLNYCAVSFYKGTNEETYKSTTDYEKERKKTETKLVNNIRDALMLNTEMQKANNADDLSITIFDHWYLFINLPFNEQLDLFKMLYKKTYTAPSNNAFAIGAGFAFNPVDHYFYFIDLPMGNPVPVSGDLPNSFFEISLGMKFQLKPVNTIFSYIRLEGGIGFSTSSVNFIPVSSNYTVQVSSSVLYPSYGYTPPSKVVTTDYENIITSEFTINNHYAVFLNISMPLLYLSDNLVTEFGVSAYMISYDYSLFCEYEIGHSVKRGYTDYNGGYGPFTTLSDTHQNESFEKNNTQSVIKCIPMAGLFYSASTSLNICFRATYNAASLRIFYLF